jgi:hypothetical protein
MGAEDRVAPITIISPVRRWWAWWLRFTWPLSRRNPIFTRPLVKLGFINFAHWGLFDRVPARGRRRNARRLPQPYIIFQSNFNGNAALYIDAFSLVVPYRVSLLWGRAYGYPGARPMEPFKEFIFGKHLEKDEPQHTHHYYCAYPGGSSRMIVSALVLRERLNAFAGEASSLEDEQFAASYRRFLAEVQEHL